MFYFESLNINLILNKLIYINKMDFYMSYKLSNQLSENKLTKPFDRIRGSLNNVCIHAPSSAFIWGQTNSNKDIELNTYTNKRCKTCNKCGQAEIWCVCNYL